jgi:hypothetical protein
MRLGMGLVVTLLDGDPFGKRLVGYSVVQARQTGV